MLSPLKGRTLASLGIIRGESALARAATGGARFEFKTGSGIAIRATKTDAQVAAQMDRIVERIGKRMGIGKEWKPRFDMVQDELGNRAIGMVYPNMAAMRGGEIVIDSAIFRPGGHLQKLSLRSRTQAILVHEVSEGTHIQDLRRLGLPIDRIPEIYTHNAAVAFAPRTQLSISSQARSYLHQWMKHGPYDQGIW